jgi:hypothetical protein
MYGRSKADIISVRARAPPPSSITPSNIKRASGGPIRAAKSALLDTNILNFMESEYEM